MLEQYLQFRETLCCVVLIVDIRRKPTDLDVQMRDWLVAEGVHGLAAAGSR